MEKGKHSKRYPQGSMAALNWKQLQGFMREDRRNSRQSRAHRLEALQETAKPQRQEVQLDPEFLESQAAYLSDADILRLCDIVEGIAQRRGLMG